MGVPYAKISGSLSYLFGANKFPTILVSDLQVLECSLKPPKSYKESSKKYKGNMSTTEFSYFYFGNYTLYLVQDS